MTKSKINNKKKIRLSRSLNPLRIQLAELVEMANLRVAQLNDAKVESKALDEATKTRRKVHKEMGEGVIFTSQISSMREFNREFARLQKFLTDTTSTVSGAETFRNGLTHGLFGGQWRVDGGYGADPSVVSEDTARKVFDIYHRAVERAGGWEQTIGFMYASRGGMTEYGSENLINAIYDMVEGGGEVGMSEDDLIAMYIAKAAEMIQTSKDTVEKINEFIKFGEDYGYVEKDSEREERINTWQWKIKKENL
jgi:hypothetical protein